MHCTETVDSDWGSSDTKDLYIKIRVTKEQDKQIRQMAKLCNRKVSSYVRDVARNVVIIKTDIVMQVNPGQKQKMISWLPNSTQKKRFRT